MRAGPWAGRTAVIWAAVVALLAAWAPAAARPYTVEDLVRQESFGQVAVDPSARWLVYERRVERSRGATFTLATRHEVVRNQLRVVDLARGGAARALIPGDPIGVTLGPFSPDGRRLAVYGFREGRWVLGVVTLAPRRIRWLAIDAEFPYRERTVQWRSPTELVALARPTGSLPLILRINSAGPRELTARWRRTERGEVSVTAIGSGRYLDLRPRNPPSRVVRVDVVSGRSTTVTVGDIGDLELAPGGRHLAFTEAGDDIRLTADQPVHGLNGTALRRLRLGIVDLATGEARRPAPGFDLPGQLLSWSPSGRRLLVFARRDAQPWTTGQLLSVDPQGGVETLPLGDRTAVLLLRPEAVRATWLGETPAMLTLGRGRRDWVALQDGAATVLTGGLRTVPDRLIPMRGGAMGLSDGRAWWLTPSGASAIPGSAGVVTAPTSPLWEARLLTNTPSQAASLAVQRSSDDGAWALALKPEGAGPAIALPARGGAIAAAAADGQVLALIDEDAHGVARLRLRSGYGWRLLDSVNLRQADVDPLRAVAVAQPTPTGAAPLTSWLYLPTRPPGAPPPPLIVVPYPGLTHRAPTTLADYDEPSRAPSLPIIVGAGFAVLQPSLPLAPDAEPADGLAARVLSIVEAAAVQHPGTFDAAQLGLWGHSFGGYGTVAILTQTDRFRAAVAMAPPTDLVSAWGVFQAAQRIDPSDGLGVSARTGWTEDAQGAMRAPPWRDPGRYLRNSPLFQADRIHTPLMLMMGDQDHIPMSQSEEIFSALFRQDRDAVLLTYWGEAHAFYSPGNVCDSYQRALAWMAQHLERPDPGGAPQGERRAGRSC